jgi:general secretion pathway protein I
LRFLTEPLQRCSRQAGFSLLEVLVAFSILAMALGVLMQIFSLSANNVRVAADYTKAVAVAESKLAGAGVIYPLERGTVSGEEMEGKFTWTLRSTPVDGQLAGDSAVVPYRVDVSVAWGPPRQRRSIAFATLKSELRR